MRKRGCTDRKAIFFLSKPSFLLLALLFVLCFIRSFFLMFSKSTVSDSSLVVIFDLDDDGLGFDLVELGSGSDSDSDSFELDIFLFDLDDDVLGAVLVEIDSGSDSDSAIFALLATLSANLKNKFNKKILNDISLNFYHL